MLHNNLVLVGQTQLRCCNLTFVSSSAPQRLPELDLEVFGGLPLLVPVDGRVVHFVDQDDEIFYSGGFDEHGVFAGLAAAFESRLEFALASRNHLKKEREKTLLGFFIV